MDSKLLKPGDIFEHECRYVVNRQIFPTKLRFTYDEGIFAISSTAHTQVDIPTC